MSHTPRPWTWWTSNSYRRLKHDDRGKTTNVLEAYVCRDGCMDILVSQEDMALIAAAPDLLEALEDLISDAEKQMANPSHHMPFSMMKAKAAIAKAQGRAQG